MKATKYFVIVQKGKDRILNDIGNRCAYNSRKKAIEVANYWKGEVREVEIKFKEINRLLLAGLNLK